MRTGKPAYDSGMRGKEKPDVNRDVKGKLKTPIKRLSIEKGDSGYKIEVQRHDPPPKKGKDGTPQYEPNMYERTREEHLHSSKDSAIAHHTKLLDEMESGCAPGGAEKAPTEAAD